MKIESMGRRTPVWDVVIAGAGIAGATLALTLKQSAGDAVRVALCDPALAVLDGDRPASFRTVAVAADTRAHLDRLGLWHGLAAEAHPIRRMVITDGRPGLLPNLPLLTFDDAEPDHPIAHMIFVEPVRRALLTACRAAGVVFVGSAALGFVEEPQGLTVSLSDNTSLRTRLLAAADGGRSRLRHAARIQSLDVDYPQSAIVATLHHTEEHQGQATQHFFPAGPLALLPMRSSDGAGHRTSIVWTESRAEAARLVDLRADGFVAALQERMGYERGRVTLEDRPQAYPLRLSVARRLASGRLALLGDAARVVHPLAGQGLNLGLRDAIVLASHAGERANLGLDPGAPDVLAAYERERRPDTVLMAATTHALDRLFSTDAAPVRMARDLGLGLVDRSPLLKRQFAQSAGSSAAPRSVTGRWRARAPVLR